MPWQFSHVFTHSSWFCLIERIGPEALYISYKKYVKSNYVEIIWTQLVSYPYLLTLDKMFPKLDPNASHMSNSPNKRRLVRIIPPNQFAQIESEDGIHFDFCRLRPCWFTSVWMRSHLTIHKTHDWATQSIFWYFGIRPEGWSNRDQSHCPHGLNQLRNL